MNLSTTLCALLVCAGAAIAQDAALRGVVTDPLGALVPGTLVQLRGPGGEQRKTTGNDGQYSFTGLRAGRYNIRYIARGFGVTEKRAVEIAGSVAMDVQLTMGVEAQVVNVDD